MIDDISLPTCLGPLLLALMMVSAGCNRTAETPGPTHETSRAVDAIDVSGVRLFWEMADTIASGPPPSDEMWDRFFAHPGYRLLKNIGGRENELRDCLPAVFDPTQRRTLDDRMQTMPSLHRRVCSHLDRVRSLRREVNAYATRVPEQRLMEEAIREAAAYLPPARLDTLPLPAVYLTLHEPTNFGWDGTIVYDLLDMRDKSRTDNVLVLGHEVHHAMWASMLRWSLPAKDQDSYPLLYALFRVQMEGIASMVDKRRFISADPRQFSQSEHQRYAREFTVAMRRMPEAVRAMDTVLVEAAAGERSLRSAGHGVQEVLSQQPYSPHLPGLYVAMTIEEALGRRALVEASVDPLRFWEAYQASAQKLGDRAMFRSASMRLLERVYTAGEMNGTSMADVPTP